MSISDDSQLTPPPIPERAIRRTTFWRSWPGRLTFVVLALGGLLVIASLAFEVGIELGYLPDTAAVPGSEIPEPVLETLRGENIVDENEQVLFFYSSGFWSFLADGNLFTDRRVISYEEAEGGGRELYSADYSEITAIEPTWSESVWDNSYISVQTASGDEFYLWVSPENERDHEFYDSLRAAWTKRR